MILRSFVSLPVFAIITLAIATPSIAGQATCGSTPPGWTATQPDSMRALNTVAVHGDSDSESLTWNGAPATHEQIRQYVEITKMLKPVPTLLLSVSPSADCDEVRRLRRMIDQTLTCENGQCVERGS